MVEMEQYPILTLSPSLSSYSSSSAKFAEIASDATASIEPPLVDNIGNDDDDDGDDDFEFALVSCNADGSPISADEIFSNGQIRPTFPVFNCSSQPGSGSAAGHVPNTEVPKRLRLRQLFDDERPPLSCSNSSLSSSSSSSSSSSLLETYEELEGIPPDTYCVWRPGVERCRKSNSTGTSKRWKLRDLLYRSSSDGKEKLVLFAHAAEKKEKVVEVSKDTKIRLPFSGDEGRAMTMTATKSSKWDDHNNDDVRKARGKKTNQIAAAALPPSPPPPPPPTTTTTPTMEHKDRKKEERRESFLPYKKDIMGFFSSARPF